MDNLIGVDYGTTNSCAVYNDAGKELVIEASSGHNTLPSVVAVNSDGSFIVGPRAQKRLIHGRKDEARYVFSNIKRELGRKHVEGETLSAQMDIDEDGQTIFVGPGEQLYTPEQLAGEILRTIKEAAERRIGKKVKGAVITIPAGYTPAQMEATLDAAELAGFVRKKVTLLSEPEAAAVAYNFGRKDFRRILVFDMGGGTFDTVLMDYSEGLFKPLKKDGSPMLGGIDFDRRIETFVVDHFESETGIDLRTKPISMLKLAPAVEDGKKELTDGSMVDIYVEDGALDTEDGRFRDVRARLSREQFETMVQDLIDRAMGMVEGVLAAAEVDKQQVQDVVLVGGMTRVPAIRKALADYFGEKKLRDTISPDTAIARGAAIRAAELDGRLVNRTNFDQITSHAYGIAGNRDEFILCVPRGVEYGTKETFLLSNQKKNQAQIPIAVLQGQNKKASTNEVIGSHFVDILPCEKGGANVELTFEVLETGLLKVYGQNLDTEEGFVIIGAD